MSGDLNPLYSFMEGDQSFPGRGILKCRICVQPYAVHPSLWECTLPAADVEDRLAWEQTKRDNRDYDVGLWVLARRSKAGHMVAEGGLTMCNAPLGEGFISEEAQPVCKRCTRNYERRQRMAA